MKRKGKKNETVEDVCRKFKEAMQRIVDRKDSGFSRITMTLEDKEIVIAEKKRKL